MRSQEKRLIPVCITRKDGKVFYTKCLPDEFIILGGGTLDIIDGNGVEFKNGRGEPSGKKPLTKEYKKMDFIESIKKISEQEFKAKELKKRMTTKEKKA